ncbi:MAG: hypothetical protein R3E88_22225 [Myxococcota bacterium]|nr:hypothetical protein [Myxococcales bacterium]
METRKSFRVALDRDAVVERLCDDATLVALLPGDTEIVDRKGDRRTTRTRYSALGREGTATFHFDFLLDGNVRFEKVCDGKIWKRLTGSVEVEEDGDGSRVSIAMEGRTKPLVPELAIKAPLEDQMRQMTSALRTVLGG